MYKSNIVKQRTDNNNNDNNNDDDNNNNNNNVVQNQTTHPTRARRATSSRKLPGRAKYDGASCSMAATVAVKVYQEI